MAGIKKIAYILNHRMPTEKAYGIQVASMCQAFAAQGMQVELVVPTRDPRAGEDVFGYYKIPPTFSVQRLKTFDISLPGILDKAAFALKQWISAWQLVRYAIAQKADIIYTRDEHVAWLASWLIPFEKSRPKVTKALASPGRSRTGLTRRVVFEAHTFSRKRMLIYRRLRNHGVRVVVISKALAREFENIGVLKELILVAPDGVNIEKFDISVSQEDARKQLDLSGDKNIVMYTGHLFPWKGAHILAQAAREIPEALFVFVGGMAGDVDHFRNRFRNQKNIVILDQRPHDQIPLYLKAADVLVLPNTSREAISKSYTSPLKLFEYMASGRPIVASDLPSIREVLDGEMAVLVEPDSPRALANGIKSILYDDDLGRLLARVAFGKVQGYQWDERAQHILKFDQTPSTLRIGILTNNMDPRTGWGRYASELVVGLRKAGVEVRVLKERLDAHEGKAILARGGGILRAAWRTKSSLNDCDLVHALDVYPYGIIGWFVSLWSRKPLIITAQGTYSIAPFFNTKTRWLSILACRQAEYVTAVSNFTLGSIAKEAGITRGTVILHGIDTKRFLQSHEMISDIFVLSVGALKWRKGYHISIPAFAIARKQFPTLRYVIVGDQDDAQYMEKLKELLRAHNITDAVEFISDVSEERLSYFYRTAQAFMLTSVNQDHHVEGFGLVFLEAAAAGLPAIGTLGNGIEDAVKDGYNGLLVPQSDILATAKALGNILSDQDLWNRMSAAGHVWAKSHDLSAVVEKYLMLYRQAIK